MHSRKRTVGGCTGIGRGASVPSGSYVITDPKLQCLTQKRSLFQQYRNSSPGRCPALSRALLLSVWLTVAPCNIHILRHEVNMEGKHPPSSCKD